VRPRGNSVNIKAGLAQNISVHWTESYFEHLYQKRWALGPASAATHAEAAHLLTLLDPPRELPLLDLACGQGRYAVPLASLGRRVVALDASRALLTIAAQQTARTATSPRWVRGDMRSLPLAPSFGGVLLLDSFGFFDQEDENVAVLREIRRVVQPKGRLLIAVANGTPILADFRPHDEERRGSVVLAIDRTLRREPAQLIEKITVREPNGVAHYERRQRLYTCRELIALLEAAAFGVRAVSADYGGGRFDDAASPKIVILAEAR